MNIIFNQDIKCNTNILLASILLILCCGIMNVEAGGLDGFLKYTTRGGSLTSVNAGGIIQDQKSGYLTGGSIINRGPRPMELQPLNVQLPSMEFDACSGSYDVRWGGIGYLKGSEFISYFKKLAGSVGGYVAKLAIKQACPQCEDIMSYLESVARDINGMTLNQCEQGKEIAEGLLNKFNSAKKQRCLSKASIGRSGDDLYASTEACQKDPDKHGEKGDEHELKSMLPDNYNLVWKALSHGDGSTDNGMKELMMSIAGSIIGKTVNKQMTIQALPSLVEKEDLLERYIGKAALGVNKIKMYKCDDSKKCLNPTIVETQIKSQSETLYGKVSKNIKSITNKINNNKGALTDEENALIEYSQIPLINLLEIELALRGGDAAGSFSEGSEFIEVVCYDVVTNFMIKMLSKAQAAVDSLESSQLDNTPIERFNRNIQNVQILLRDKKFNVMKKLQMIILVKERLLKQQDIFEMGFSRFAGSQGF